VFRCHFVFKYHLKSNSATRLFIKLYVNFNENQCSLSTCMVHMATTKDVSKSTTKHNVVSAPVYGHICVCTSLGSITQRRYFWRVGCRQPGGTTTHPFTSLLFYMNSQLWKASLLTTITLLYDGLLERISPEQAMGHFSGCWPMTHHYSMNPVYHSETSRYTEVHRRPKC